MSYNIDSLDELQNLVKRLGVKVETVDDLRRLLATINAPYDAEMARQKTLRLIGTLVACIGWPVGGLVSLFALAPNAREAPNHYSFLAVAVVWATVVLMSLVGLFLVLWALRGTRNTTTATTGSQAPAAGGTTGRPASPASAANYESDSRFTRIENPS
jgi:hypothetical protein